MIVLIPASVVQCCDEQLRKDLARSAGSTLTSETEENILKSIKILAVSMENAVVARVTLNSMHQDSDETICSFGARLRGKASVCKYMINCPDCHREVNYIEPILRDALCPGIEDSKIQLDLFGNTNQNMSLEEIFCFVEANEAGKRAASRLLDSHCTESIKSSYRRSKKDK